MGASPGGAAVAGAAFAFAPWRFGQVGHLQVLSGGGVALAVALLLRGHAGTRTGGSGRPWTALLGWLVATWQVSLGFGIGLWFGYGLVVGAAVAVARWWRAGRRWPGWRLVVADAAGATVLAGVGALLAAPYFQVVHDFPSARRTLAEVGFFSPPLSGLWTAPQINRLWGPAQEGLRSGLAWPPEMTLAVGATLVALALLGLLVGRWSARARLAAAAGAVVLVVLLQGTSLAGGWLGYRELYAVLPGWDSLRTPGRLVQPLTLLLAVLAALGVDALRRAVRATPAAPALLGPLLVLAVLLEGASAIPTPPVPAAPVRLADLPPPVFVLSPDPLADTAVMLWSTDGFPAVVNGVSGFVPPPYQALRDAQAGFPDATAVAALRAYGIRSVVLPTASFALPPADLVARLRQAGLSARPEDAAVVVDLR